MTKLAIVLIGLAGSVGCGSSSNAGMKHSRAEGGAGSGGMSGAGGSGATGAGGGGAAGMLGAPQWLAYVAPEGNFAYDAATYPATDAVTLSAPPGGIYLNGTPPAWSPDGKHLAYFAGTSLALRDMTAHTPGPEVTLATALTPSDDPGALQWSPDSTSITVVSGSSLYALDPTAPSPTLNLVTSNTIRAHRAAPAGGGLLFRDDSGVSFVRVAAGVPSTPEPVAMIGNSWGWSRDGSKFLVQDGLDLVLFDVSGQSIQRTPVVTLPALGSYADPVFDSDGSLFAFNTDQGIAYAATSAPALTGLIESPVSGAVTQSAGFSPIQPVMVFTVSSSPIMQSGQWFYVEFSGSTPSAVTPIPGTWQYLYWVPGKLAMFATDLASGQASYIDLSGAAPVVTPYPTLPDPVVSVQWAPVGERLAFFTNQAVILTSLSDPSAPPQSFTSMQGEIAWTGWSSAASFMAILSSSRSFQDRGLEVVRVDGATPSAVKPLHAPGAASAVNFAWQPVTP